MTALTKVEKLDNSISEQFSTKETELLRDTICKGATAEEFNLFLNVCKMTGLNPFVKQIYPVKRWDNNLNRLSMTVQTGIDGLRLIAERTGKYCPGREPTFTYKEGKVFSATAYVKKLTADGTWHEIARTAFYDEFCQSFKDKKSGELKPTQFWDNMPHNQLAKCAETLCLKTAFPAETSCVQTPDVMAQAYDSAENKVEIKPLEIQEKKVSKRLDK